MAEVEVPKVAAWRSGMQLVILCPHCGWAHWHGAVGPSRGDGDGERAAHCLNGRGLAYVLVEV